MSVSIEERRRNKRHAVWYLAVLAISWASMVALAIGFPSWAPAICAGLAACWFVAGFQANAISAYPYPVIPEEMAPGIFLCVCIGLPMLVWELLFSAFEGNKPVLFALWRYY